MAKRHLRLVTPATVNRTVAPTRRPNADLRTREYLTEAEVQRLIKAAGRNRWGQPGHHHAPGGIQARPEGLRACGPAGGSRWSSGRPPCTSGESNRAPPAATRSSGTSCVLCGGCGASRSRSQRSCSPRSRKGRSALPGSPEWWSGQGGKPSWPSRLTRTCSGMPAGMRWPTEGTTQGRCKPILDTGISSILCATQSYR
jgi:hypothetical protein